MCFCSDLELKVLDKTFFRNVCQGSMVSHLHLDKVVFEKFYQAFIRLNDKKIEILSLDKITYFLQFY